MRLILILVIIFGAIHYWDKGLGEYVVENYKQAESTSLQWLRDNTPNK